MRVSKRDVNGREVWGYPARLLVRGAHCVRLEAFFDRPDTWLHGMLLGRGDRFLETFYSDRWYNIFEIHARQDGALRGWYCNVGYPALLGAEVISYRDLALDLLVFPDGRQVVLDEDEFAALPLDAWTRAQARRALMTLQRRFAAGGNLNWMTCAP